MSRVSTSFWEDGLYYRVVICKVSHNYLRIVVNGSKSSYSILPGNDLQYEDGIVIFGSIYERTKEVTFQYFQYMSEPRQSRYKQKME
ncbi:hypothetical protein SAMN05444266_10289 [Chitinophaga jiangningensis]|uniref:Uncharacterized protein n=1 Tax=Chitinophaga jiangningensis TaxID=1419482 RepID=A0A1M6XZY5_9BACT|nr:hypothetical protein [Chitinophaga jiangningensis]SHL11448.1 hypothetical protein SAMN05444266_10289 [Chitinophaga jiangningensis]